MKKKLKIAYLLTGLLILVACEKDIQEEISLNSVIDLTDLNLETENLVLIQKKN